MPNADGIVAHFLFLFFSSPILILTLIPIHIHIHILIPIVYGAMFVWGTLKYSSTAAWRQQLEL